MKKLISLITAFALILQFGMVSGFAAATPDKTLFKDVSEVYGIYDCSYTYSSVLEFSKSGVVPYIRDFTEKSFYASEDYAFANAVYLLSKDKKSVTVSYSTFMSGVQYQGQVIFKKDAAGKIFFNATHFTGASKIVSRAFPNLEACEEYIYSTAFSKIYLAEKSLYKKIVASNDDFAIQSKKFEDAKPISTQNILFGSYTSPDYTQYLTIDIYSASNPKDYSGFYEYTEVIYTVGASSYLIKAKNFTIKNGVALYLQDPKNYIEIKAPNRGTLSHVKIVKNGKTVVDSAISLALDK